MDCSRLGPVLGTGEGEGIVRGEGRGQVRGEGIVRGRGGDR